MQLCERFWRLITRSLVILLLVLAGSRKPGLGQETVGETELKSAFIYNFTKFIEWPDTGPRTNSSHFVIGIFSGDAFVLELQKGLAGKTARGKPILVRKLAQNADATGCHLVFFSRNEARRLTDLGSTLKNSPVLTVGDSDRFTELGGMIGLFFEDKELRFHLNLPASDAAQLQISSKLIRLAKPGRR